jgi:predicted AlkP superfamily pyrophosphatase or phosphodiesterase
MRPLLLYFFLALALQACSPAAAQSLSAVSDVQETDVPVNTTTPTATATMTSIPTPALAPGRAQRVIIISFDGLRPDAVTEAPMENLVRWMRNGAYTLEARTISPSLTLPAHASMISGLCASQHGITWNSGLSEWGYSEGVDVFDLAHAAGLRTVMIVGKDKLRQLAEPETTDVFEVHTADKDIFQAAKDQLSSGFHLMMIHIPSADDRGHSFGWMSNAQLKTLRESDALFGDFIAELDQLDLTVSTLVIVTADHGGHGKNHEGSELVDQLIPWSMVGPGVEAEKLVHPVSITDTAATAAHALDLPLQPEWAGIPVYEGFGLPSAAIHETVACKN